MNHLLNYLIIEDSLKVCDGIKERMDAFENWDACPFAHHVDDAKNIISKQKPQLIFIDWSLKGGSAYEVLAHLKSFYDYHPYIIFNTGYQSENPEIPAEIINNYKIDKYLVKPLWENLRLKLPEYLQEAERKQKTTEPNYEIWIRDENKIQRKVDISQLTSVIINSENPYCKIFNFANSKAISAKMSWQGVLKILDTNKLNYFVSNCKQHVVLKNYVETYNRPFVKMKSFPFKIEIVKDKLHDFERWVQG